MESAENCISFEVKYYSFREALHHQLLSLRHSQQAHTLLLRYGKDPRSSTRKENLARCISVAEHSNLSQTSCHSGGPSARSLRYCSNSRSLIQHQAFPCHDVDRVARTASHQRSHTCRLRRPERRTEDHASHFSQRQRRHHLHPLNNAQSQPKPLWARYCVAESGWLLGPHCSFSQLPRASRQQVYALPRALAEGKRPSSDLLMVCQATASSSRWRSLFWRLVIKVRRRRPPQQHWHSSSHHPSNRAMVIARLSSVPSQASNNSAIKHLG